MRRATQADVDAASGTAVLLKDDPALVPLETLPGRDHYDFPAASARPGSGACAASIPAGRADRDPESSRRPNLSALAGRRSDRHRSRRSGCTRQPSLRPMRRLTVLALAVLVAVLAFSAAAGAGSTAPTKRVVKVETLSDGGSVLANLKGRTLYSLSVEKHGKFICTGGCLSIWHPLVVAKGVKPTGPVSLGTVERPEGKTQVTYQGRPLYRFAEDTGGPDQRRGDQGRRHLARGQAPGFGIATAAQPKPVPRRPTRRLRPTRRRRRSPRRVRPLNRRASTRRTATDRGDRPMRRYSHPSRSRPRPWRSGRRRR